MAKAGILIVEDDALNVAKLREHLDNLQEYEVLEVTDNGEDAVRLAGEQRPGLVLMDIILNGKMDGIEAAAEIYSRFNIPVVYLTGDSIDMDKLSRVKKSEPFGYIRKPVEERELQIIMEMALYKQKMDKERKEMVAELLKALDSITQLKALIPMCVSCDKFDAVKK